MTAAQLAATLEDPAKAAQLADLRYVNDLTMPGFQRRRSGKGFAYLDTRGRAIRDPEVLGRIARLAIPPAWTDVWICPEPRGHIQATGRDDRGRKQYRYHPDWAEIRDQGKYGRLVAFGRALTQVRQTVDRHLALPGLPRERVLAAVVQLLEETLIRVGNDEYARSNRSFGLTTLRNRHASVNGSAVHFQFRGKSGILHAVDLHDRRLARIVRNCQELPGEELFAYVDQEGNVRDVGSADVNEYLNEITGEAFTAKDFRTWAGTVLAAEELSGRPLAASDREARRIITDAVRAVACRMKNTPAVCRKAYIHPAVFEAYRAGKLQDFQEGLGSAPAELKGLSEPERATLRLLGA